LIKTPLGPVKDRKSLLAGRPIAYRQVEKAQLGSISVRNPAWMKYH
jgi:hypothetical protein